MGRARSGKGYGRHSRRRFGEGGQGRERETRAQQRAAGTKKTALFEIVKKERRGRRIANRALELLASAATHSVPAEGALHCVLGQGAGARMEASSVRAADLYFSCYLQKRVVSEMFALAGVVVVKARPAAIERYGLIGSAGR
ncbi:MAG: hypothetical protein WBW74_00255 [Xanthobacteraceae bacterium]